MSTTPRLKLPLIAASQAQKHVTHNEAILMLDMLSGVIAVASRGLFASPPSPSDGDIHILAAGGVGAWAGWAAGDLALRVDGAWRRVRPSPGMVASIIDEASTMVRWNGAAWVALAGVSGATYEAGTFTPQLSFGGASTGIVQPTQLGYYVKIGQVVHVTAGVLTLSSKGTATGSAGITGFPYVPTATGAGVCGYYTGMSGMTGTIVMVINNNNPTFLLYQTGAASAVNALSHTNFNDNSQLRMSFSYRAAG